MIQIDTCRAAAERLPEYLERKLPADERLALEQHLKGCGECRARLLQCRDVHSLMMGVLGAAAATPAESAAFRAVTTGPRLEIRTERDEAEAVPAGATMLERLGGAPWWGISIALHVLLIMLVSLITMAIGVKEDGSSIVCVTNLEKAPSINVPPELKKDEVREILESKSGTVTDPDSPDANNIVIPPDILAKAEVGDHFETINPDRPDTHSAFGNPDAHMFHSASGNDEPPGGGGSGGAGLMEDMIGVGGMSSPGSGGGWGGGNGTGTGVDNGSGHGSFGNRNGGGRRLMVMRGGGGKATESAVDKGLEWLARHQDADGHWDVAKHEGKPSLDGGITALGLLAFLGAGHTEKVGKYKDNVQRAVKWIISQQEADGSIGKKYKEYWHQGYAYHHAMCGLALAEAAGMGRVKTTVEAAQKAVDYSTEIHQSGDNSDKLAWRYDPKKDADASVSGWFVMQLKSAKIAGLKVNTSSFEGALKFYDSIENQKEYDGYKGGRFPYQKGGGPMLNPSAIGILCNLFLGRKPDELRGGAEFLKENLPKWGDVTLGTGNGGGFPMYYTYYGTLTMFQMGGDYWKSWNEAMKQMFLPNQRKDGDFDGSWDPIGGKDDQLGGRVYMTAMASLCLEVYYRYMPLTRH